MSFNQSRMSSLQTNDGTKLEVKDFKYLGAWMESTAKDIKQRKAAAWTACSKLSKIWKPSLPRRFKLHLFAATVESVWLWSLDYHTQNRKGAWWLLHTQSRCHVGDSIISFIKVRGAKFLLLFRFCTILMAISLPIVHWYNILGHSVMLGYWRGFSIHSFDFLTASAPLIYQSIAQHSIWLLPVIWS